MAERLKDMFFTEESINGFADAIKNHYPGFDKPRFLKIMFDASFADKELLDKMRHTTMCLFDTLPKPYEKALEILKKAAPDVKGFEAMALPDFVATYGMEDWDLSMPALGHFTKYYSSELAIRPFLDKDPDRVLPYLWKWTEQDAVPLRRLASEGSRPRLPWAMALPRFKQDPSMILPILEKLKDDPSEDVRRSVANHVNDISKDNPDIALELCGRWYGQSANVDRIVKHACRTLLKAGDSRALYWSHPEMMGFALELPRLALNAMGMMANQVQEYQERFRQVATERVERRLARALLRLASQSGRKIEQGVLIDFPLSRQDLAEMCGTTLFTVSRTLSQWESQGIVITGRERVIVRYPHGLVRIAEDLPPRTDQR